MAWRYPHAYENAIVEVPWQDKLNQVGTAHLDRWITMRPNGFVLFDEMYLKCFSVHPEPGTTRIENIYASFARSLCSIEIEIPTTAWDASISGKFRYLQSTGVEPEGLVFGHYVRRACCDRNEGRYNALYFTNADDALLIHMHLS